MRQNATSHFQQVQAQHRQQVADMHRNMATFAMGTVAPIGLQNQQQPQISYQQVASPPPMQVQPIFQQIHLPREQQQQAQIEYQPMSPASPVQQVQYQNQPMPRGGHFPQQQAQIAYSPLPPTQPMQLQEVEGQEEMPQSPPLQRI
jgi:hypothetical protein